MSVTIISGGQTGVDRGALDAALSHNVPCGGWCPEGRQAEDGVIDEKYPLEVLPDSGYRMRTRQNVMDTDATIIIYFSYIYLRGGTELTLMTCIKKHKPYLLIDGDELTSSRAGERIKQFIDEHNIERLNFAGPRGSAVDYAHCYTQDTVSAMLKLM